MRKKMRLAMYGLMSSLGSIVSMIMLSMQGLYGLAAINGVVLLIYIGFILFENGFKKEA